MNKKQLVENVATEMETKKSDAVKWVDAVINCVKAGVISDGSLQLIGFGSFKVKARKARKGRNPQTGKVIKIKASKTVTFKPGKVFKATL